MTKVRFFVLLAVLAAGCAKVEEKPLYQKGDFVVYSYSGSYRKDPVRLKKSVLARQGNKLEMLVEWSSGAQQRSWKQFMTDTAYNRANNIVDRLVVLDGGKERELENRDNMDLFKLYEGTFIMPQSLPRLLSSEKRQLKIAGRQLDCEIKTYRVHMFKKHARQTAVDCAGFPWGPAGTEYRYITGEELIYKAEVLDFLSAENIGGR